jgi:type I restriction enzyme R subunit
VSNPTEEQFERAICDWLAEHGGYDAVKNDKLQGDPRDFDPVRGLDTAELFTFLGSTQGEAWELLVGRYDGDRDAAQRKLADRLANELDKRGVVDVLRRGVVDQGVTFKLAYFKPAHGLTPELVQKYGANRLTATRQLRYAAGSGKALDLALFVNGIPVATAELKNPLTGQGVEHAISQYRKDRSQKNRTLARAVVHFAVDPQRVAMTTRLANGDTRFLPFNRGVDNGAGNPQNPTGHATAYLWERVWQRDAWLDLLGRFVHVDKPAKGSKKPGQTIFPRYHQWDAVLRLEAAAREEGAGHSYLVQHSAGSGKSNTIAWLAHRLSTLHAGNTKVFDKVVVITDRIVLDRQLQETIYQFEHVHGVVERVEKSSQQLADALTGERARIIITTLQKFPFVLSKVQGLPGRRYAVIVDEAHSSQTGEAARELRRVLGAGPAKADDEGDLPSDAVEAALVELVAARGRQDNMSFFAFTATPKGKTLGLFGRLDPATGKHEPFHLYSMRQAIEERFIHDVLANYTTYDMFFRLEKAVADDPKYETAKARRAIARFVTLHEHNLAQKAEIVVEHFRTHVARKVGGHAKAMVVCGSREHAVRFWQALKSYAKEHGRDVGVLVAFSDAVTINGDDPVTEFSCNGFADTQTAAKFDTDSYQIMVVAEKFQTGFDQPKLYAMYVDKTLTGLAAVQTLSRLNRIHPDKDGTFVLDFVNDAGSIAASFGDYYARTVSPPSDPNLLWDTRYALDEFGVIDTGEAITFARLLLAERADHGRLHSALGPAIDRFHGLEPAERERFREALGRFVRTYSFLSQIVAFTDTSLERDYVFGKALQAFVKADPGAAVDLSDAVELTHLRHEQRFAGSVALDPTDGEVSTVYAGTGRTVEPEPEPLSAIIEQLNAKFGTEWQEADRLFRATLDRVIAREDVQVAAMNSSQENFGLVFPEYFQRELLGQLEHAEKVVYRYLDDEELQHRLHRYYAVLVQARAQVAYQEHCPIGELLGGAGENAHLEYKSTLRTHADSGELFKPLETASIKTVAAFANSRQGGTLLVGVADDGTVHGLAGDYASLHKPGKDDRDRFQLHLSQLLIAALGETVASTVSVQLHTVDGADLCRVHVTPSTFPVDANVIVEKDGQSRKKTAFYVRIGNGTREITDPNERQRYIATRWGADAPLATQP